MPAEKTETSPKRRKRAPEDGWDVVLDAEVDGHNRNPKFVPTGEMLRGTIRSNLMFSDRVNGSIAAVGQIPGQRILVDLEGWHIKIIDRMTLAEHRDIDQALRRDARRREDIRIKDDWQYLPDQDVKFTKPDQWAKCLWHMRRMVDNKKLKVVSGKLPSLREILKQGKIVLNRHHIPIGHGAKPWNVIDDSYIEELDRLEEQESLESVET